MSAPLVGRLAIIGAGLIGSSVARAVREKGLAGTVVVADRDAGVRARVRELGFADEVPETAAEAVADADIVIVCVPVGEIGRAHV